MIFDLRYRDTGDNVKSAIFSGANFASVLVYCDANNLTPTLISEETSTLIRNLTDTSVCYTVILKNESTKQFTTYTIYDSIDNIISWINNQPNMSLQNINKQNSDFVIG